jgi:hypothetical protein
MLEERGGDEYVDGNLRVWTGGGCGAEAGEHNIPGR